MRWDPGFLCSGSQFRSFWTELANEPNSKRRGLLIVGRGFDPRTTEGPSEIASSGFPVTTCCLIRLTNPLDIPDRPRNPDAAHNDQTIRDLFPNSVRLKEIPIRNQNGNLVNPGRIRSFLTEEGWPYGFTDVIVDITALPISVTFPLLGTLISIYDEKVAQGEEAFNLHCIVCENADTDEGVVAEGGDTAEYLSAFRGRGGLLAQPDPITVWAPVLGERQLAVLRKVYDLLDPDEVKPFLPSPSRNPRRGDDLVSEYHSLLFDTWDVDPRDFIYADEGDPFDIYRQISELASDYETFLQPIGNVNTVVSTHSSKLLSLGVLLAALENGLAVAHVEPTDYTLGPLAANPRPNELFEVWLTGEAYETN